MAEKAKITPRERAKLAAAKRRAGEAKKGGFHLVAPMQVYVSVAVVVVSVISYFVFNATQSPPVIPLSEITASRVQLSDGRHVAFFERGVSSAQAKYQVLVLHAWHGCRLSLLPNISDEFLIDRGVRMVSYDRPGFGQSDPFPKRTVLTEAKDIAEIANLLDMGPKFYVLAFGMGGYAAWGALQAIPEKLAGVTMVAPVGSFVALNQTLDEVEAAWTKLTYVDRILILVARNFPAFVHFTWNSFGLSKWSNHVVPYVTKESEQDNKLEEVDIEIISKPEIAEYLEQNAAEALRQGPTESIYRDIIVSSQKWGFDITDINLVDDRLPRFSGEIHIWQGTRDLVVPRWLQNYAKRALPGINLHVVEGVGHYFVLGNSTWTEKLIASLLHVPHAVE